MLLAIVPTQTWRAKNSTQHLLLALAAVLLIIPAANSLTSGYHGNSSSSSLSLVNPWLSACDISTPVTATDLQGTCNVGIMMTKDYEKQHTTGVGGGFTTTNSGRSNNNNNNNYNNNKKKNLTNSLRSTANIIGKSTGEITQGPGPPASSRASDYTSSSPSSQSSCQSSCGSCENHDEQQEQDIYNNNLNNNNNQYFTTNQCLCYLDESHKERVCGGGRGAVRGALLAGLRLRHCCHHSVLDALSAEAGTAVLNASAAECRRHLAALLEVDALAAAVSCKFGEVLARYDCEQRYSVRFECSHCQEAYRRWTCASLLPHFLRGGRRVRPCRSVCQQVEQRCPFFLPGDRAPGLPTQYAGEPTFLCLDPNIPETGEQLARSSYGDEGCCYSHCGGGSSLCVSPQCGRRPADKWWSPEQCEPPPSAPAPGVGRTDYSACAAPSLPHMQPASAANTTRNTLSLLLLLLLLLLLVGDNNCCWKILTHHHGATSLLYCVPPLIAAGVLTNVFLSTFIT